MSAMLERAIVPLTLLLALSLVACDKNSGTSKTVCQTDALMCPDGTSVGRQGPNCEFAPCPPSKPPAKEEPVACTMDAKMCPDGSSVGRQGPNCEFEPCPGETPAAPQ
jgi:hypothetical protein